MDKTQYLSLLKEIKKLKKPEDLVKITLKEGEQITAIIIEQIAAGLQLEGGIDTGTSKPSVFIIHTLNHTNPRYSNVHMEITINDIIHFEAVSM
ncbi:MAG: hypothetical protein HQ565_07835 [Bacteroidetes bacterium]|nr:hypothetical protein [Bacteroidota bacterium]